MKIEIDKYGRKLYKFSSSVAQGGYVYSHKTNNGVLIENTEGLRNALNAVAKKFELIDVTIKIYDRIFFLFFMTKPSIVPQKLIDTIQEDITAFSSWDENYLWTGVYDLQEKYVRKDMEKWGYDFDQG